ncbi:hypothetical protein [Clostridium saccharoperbutylacetonicum]|nr:hypothetical protein [Clostridium saccharoperbutylacetonicum]
MKYKGWIIAIYDKYELKYNEKYKNINNKKKFKELSFKKKAEFVGYFTSIVIGAVLYGAGILLNNPWKFVIGALLMIGPPMISIYFDKFKIEVYKRHARVLMEVLEEENINTVSVIERLIKDTSGGLYKINYGEINNYIKLVTSVVGIFGAAFGAGNLLDKLNGQIKNIAIFLILIIICGVTTYLISLEIPKSKK